MALPNQLVGVDIAECPLSLVLFHSKPKISTSRFINFKSSTHKYF